MGLIKLVRMDITFLKTIKDKYFEMSLLRKLRLLFWTMAVFCYFFQAPFKPLSSLILPCLGLYLLTLVPNFKLLKNKIFIGLGVTYIVFLLFSAVMAIKNGTGIGRIIRFLVILYAIPGTFCLEDKTDLKLKGNVFVYLATAKAFMLISFGLCMVLMNRFMPFRLWAEFTSIGDMYLIGKRPYVQLHGNALMVMAFMLEYINKKKITLPLVVLLGGILVAGNFAFVLGIICFFGYRVCLLVYYLYKKNKLNKKILLICIVIGGLLFAPYAIKKFTEKMFKSNVVRMEQIAILTDTNPLIGKGLGNEIHAETTFRIYSAPTYFEMQTFYIYNQIGAIGLGLFYIITLWMAFKKGINKLLIYLIYLFYTFWNPYCFDTTQLFAIILIFYLMDIDKDYEKNSDYYFIFSKKGNSKQYLNCIKTS